MAIVPAAGEFLGTRRAQPVSRSDAYLRHFWVLAALMAAYIAYRASSLQDFGMAMLVASAAMLPAYLWSAGLVQGIPIGPLFGLTYVGAYAIPLVLDHYSITSYAVEERWEAAFTVTGFLLLVTAVWFAITRGQALPGRPARIRLVTGLNPDRLMLTILGLATLFLLSAFGGWFPFDAVFFTLIKQVSLALGAISAFALSVRLGEGDLTRGARWAFLGLLAANVIVSSSGLFLVGSITTCALVIAGYVKGSGRAPWLTILALVGIFSVLHPGKAEMREQYWEGVERNSVQVWEYPQFFSHWAVAGLRALLDNEAVDDSSSALGRLAVINMLLKVQTETPASVPYIGGATYEVIPIMFIPRIFYPDKLSAQEGMIMMNIYYDTQTRDDADLTAIGWGMLAEAYANFGYPGCVFLAVFFGVFYGFVTRWSLGYPVLSARFLFAITVLMVAIQSEFSASIYFTSLFQAAMSVLALSLVAMRNVANPAR